MLKLFPSRPDHPLADVRELQRAVTEIGAHAPDEALREVTSWLETIAPVEEGSDPASLFRLLLSFDEAMQPHARHLAERYVASALKWGPAATQRWQRARTYLAMLCDRYADLLKLIGSGRKPYAQLTSDVSVRQLRATSALQRWDALRYGPIDPQHWKRCGDAYLAALHNEQAAQPVRLRSGRQTETTAEREYLRTVAFATAALDELSERQIMLAGQVIHYVLGSLHLSTTPDRSTVFWIDPARGEAPVRMARPPEPSPTVRFFSGGDALGPLFEMEQQLKQGELPPALGASTEDVPLLSALLHHLIHHWSETPPVRRHRRHKLPGKLHVVEGLDPLADQLGKHAGGQLSLWEQQDASTHGIGLSVRVEENSRLRIGALLGLHSNDGTRWIAAAVRRMQRKADATIHVGVEVLSWHPIAADADDGSQHVRVLLLDPLQRDATIRLVVPAPGVRPNAPLFLLGQNKALKLTPLALIEQGDQYEIRSYQVAANH